MNADSASDTSPANEAANLSPSRNTNTSLRECIGGTGALASNLVRPELLDAVAQRCCLEPRSNDGDGQNDRAEDDQR